MSNYLMSDNIVYANARINNRGLTTGTLSGTVNVPYDAATEEYPANGITNSSGTFTVQAAGQYRVRAQLQYSTSSIPNAITLTIKRNGTGLYSSNYQTGDSIVMMAEGIVSCDPGDEIVVEKSGTPSSFNPADNVSFINIERITDYSAGQPVGFGVATDTNYGLVRGGRVPSNTDGSNPTGYLGEIIEGTTVSNVSMTDSVATNYDSITLTPGTWLMYGQVYFNETGVSTLPQTRLSISDTSNTEDFAYSNFINHGNTIDHSALIQRVVTISSSTTFYLVGRVAFTGGAMNMLADRSTFYGVRIG